MTFRASPPHQHTTVCMHTKIFMEGKPIYLPRGDSPLNKPYKYVPPQRVGFLRRFGLKTGIDFARCGLALGMVFEETMGVYERINRFSSK